MTRETILIILSVLVFISPFVGLPLSVLSWVIPTLAACIFLIAFQMRARRNARRIMREAQAATEQAV